VSIARRRRSRRGSRKLTDPDPRGRGRSTVLRRAHCCRREDLTVAGIYDVLDARFSSSAAGDQQLEMLYDNCRWAEGPIYVPAGRYLIWSDIPNDRLLRWDETNGVVSVFRSPAGNVNGNVLDLQGRFIMKSGTAAPLETSPLGSRL
jgi:hypothetical protein